MPRPGQYDGAAHHRHESVTPPLACASCHMPTRTYMVDRSSGTTIVSAFRAPTCRVKLGTPNACNDCHADKSPRMGGIRPIERWHGPNRKGFQTYAAAFQAAWTGKADAARLLAQVAADRGTPAIARATALTELGSRLTRPRSR